MSKKLISGLFATLFLFLSAPLASAADIPLLTWERGKEQNIVLGGYASSGNWRIELNGLESKPLTFHPSSVNSKGYLVYSVQLPKDFKLGSYTINVFGGASTKPSVVAGVNVIGMTTYAVTQIPADLKFLLLSLAFIVSIFGVIRARKYSVHSYPREITLMEDGSLVHDARFPRSLYKAYQIRTNAISGLKPSPFKFFVGRDSRFLHFISPVLWTAFPGAALVLGLAAGFATQDRIPNIPIYYLAGLAVVGLADSYSGVFGAFGFAAAQIMLGNVTSLRAVLILIAFGIGWTLPGLFGDLLYLMSQRDFKVKEVDRAGKGITQILLVVSALFVGLFFYFAQILADSLSTGIRTHLTYLVASAAGLTLLYIGKNVLVSLFEKKLINSGNATFERFEISGLASPTAATLFALWTFAMAYVWSESWTTAVIMAGIIAAPVAALLVRLSKPEIKRLARWNRNVYFELLIVLTLSTGLFLYIGKLPLLVARKSEIMLAIGMVPVLLHALLASLYDVTGLRNMDLISNTGEDVVK